MCQNLGGRQCAEGVGGILSQRMFKIESLSTEVISPDIRTEWKMLHHFMAKQPKSDMKSQLKEQRSTQMLKPVS